MKQDFFFILKKQFMKETIFLIALFASLILYTELQAKAHDKKSLTDNGIQYMILIAVVTALWTTLYMLSH